MTSDEGHSRWRHAALAAVVVIALVGAWVASSSGMGNALRGPMSIFGPGEDDREVLEALRADPAAGLAPRNATLDYEWSGIESAITVYRRFCTRQPLRDVRRFYGEELPDLGWSAVAGSGRFSRVVGGSEATLELERNAGDECPGFDVLISSDGA